MQFYRRLIAIVLQMLAMLCAVSAYAAPTHITAALIAEAPSVPGAPATLAILMQPEPGWHGYWLNPGDAGLGLDLDWHLPAGVTAGPLRYPVPQTLLLSGLMNHIFDRDYAVLVDMAVPVSAKHLPLTVNARWLACTEQICVPESATLSADLALASHNPRFDLWRAKLPAPLGSVAAFDADKTTIRIAIPLPASQLLSHPHLFLATPHLADYAAPQQFARKGDWLIVSLKRGLSSAPVPATLTAVLRQNDAGDGWEISASPGAVPDGGTPLGDSSTPALGWLLVAAFAGGFLLNIMPCVFPILGLKAISLARAGGDEATARAEALAYTGGVVLACVALGALLLALRAGGSAIGWAFQLQEPLVVAALLLLAVAITANLAGLFELAIPGFAARPARGAFATGLLAAFAATPCTGPFMAVAMGAALLLAWPLALLLFAALGLGLALPFLALGFIPALRRMLPKPGAWMVWFRRLMAVPMGLTAVALGWLCWREGGMQFALATGLLALLLVSDLATFGRKQRAGKSGALWLAVGLATIVVIGALLLPNVKNDRPASSENDILSSRPFSEAALATARAQHHPVFVYFTADWCLTCKVNEHAAIERAETRDAFAKAGVLVLIGDWTRRDAAITRFLSAHGAAGVPFYLWYPANGAAPEQLPQVLTTSMLTDRTKPQITN